MPGDATFGAVLRELRTTRGMTLAAVARQAGCTESLLSYVESGRRQVHPWLAEKLDGIYRTGGAIASLARINNRQPQEGQTSGVPRSDVFVVQLPRGGTALPLSRRELLASLGLGVVNGGLRCEFERALDAIERDSDLWQYFDDEYVVFREAAHMLPPAQIVDALIGNVAILNGLRRRSLGTDRNRCGILQARYANVLSWMNQEIDDMPGALWWNDRASHWAQSAAWSHFSAWSFIRRSAMVHQYTGDGLQVLDEARPVLDMPDASPRLKGLAAGQIAYGYALAGNQDESRRALDAAMDWLAEPLREDDTVLCQRAVPNDDYFALYETTCDLYLGYGARTIAALESLPEKFAGISLRLTTVTRAKLARAYANAGLPDKACRMAWDALDATERVHSQHARTELQRSLPVLNRWGGRSDVRDVVHRLQN